MSTGACPVRVDAGPAWKARRPSLSPGGGGWGWGGTKLSTVRNPSPHPPVGLRLNPVPRKEELLHPHRIRHRQWRIGTVEELDRGEVQFVRPGVLEIVHLEVTLGVALVTGLAGRVGVLHDGAVIEIRARLAAGRAGPEVIEDMTVEAKALA